MSKSIDVLNHFVLESCAARDVLIEVVDKLDSLNYFKYPGSIHHHDNFGGGLVKHSLQLSLYLYDWTKLGLISWHPMYRSEVLPPILVGLLHDLCKINKYKFVDGEWIYNQNALEGHGDLSEALVSMHFKDIKFTKEVMYCIKYHMGVYDNDFSTYDEVIKQFPNIMWVHHADMLASKSE